MKRMTSLILALLLALGLAAPAMAAAPEEAMPEQASQAAGMDDDLAELAVQVKQTLGIGDDYGQFTSDYYDGIAPYWNMLWADEERSLSVDVRADGTLLSVNRWVNDGDGDRFYGFDPAFPALDRPEAEDQAQEWFTRLFTGPETARVDDVHTVLGTNGSYRFSGTVEKNGLPSPVTFALCIDGTGLTSFYRSDRYSYAGALPAAEPAVDEDAAADSLAGAVELELRYVSDGEGGADLRYVPVGPYTVVDAQSGEAVDMDALYASFDGEPGVNGMYSEGAGMAEEAMAMDKGASLTEVELTSIENYGDVMDQDEIDASLRGLSALGLDDFQLQLCSYSMDSDAGDVTAALRYTAPMTGEELYGYTASGYELSQGMELELVIQKYITLDAKTGALKSVSTTYPLWEKDPEVTMTGAVRERAAENFLSLAAPELLPETELCTLKGCNEGDTVTYAQVHEGYFYPDNCLSVTVNPSSGTVDAYTCRWEDVRFGPAGEPVTAQQARDAYTKALDVTLGYVTWPVDITLGGDELYAKLLEQGYVYVEELRLGYYYGGTEKVLGVDGITGEALTAEELVGGQYTYDDLENVALAPEIQALAQAGIGFDGGKFLPEAELTQREAVCLLLQADGETVLPGEEDDRLLERTQWRGFVTAQDWDPAKTVTRMEFIRMVLGASRYGDGARLLNITADEGYEVMALALGMDTSDPESALTRADAAEILYRFMDR